jgi:hypothetical protein
MLKTKEEISYDTQRKLLHFQMTERGITIECAISKAALALLEDDALAGPAAMATTYLRNKARIQGLALEKYRGLKGYGIVIVSALDLGALGLQPGAQTFTTQRQSPEPAG